MSDAIPVPARVTVASDAMISPIRSAILLAICFGTLIFCYLTRNTNTVTEAGVNLDLPIFVGQFVGENQPVSLSEKTMLPGDTKFAKKIYTSFNAAPVSCQIVLSGGEKRSIHRPETCLPGQGWTISDARKVPVRLDNGRTQTVMKLTLTRIVEVAQNDRRKITSDFFYWFVGKDKTTAEHRDRVMLTSWDRVFHNVNHRWAYVIVSGMVNDQAGTESKTEAELKKFIAEIAPKIQLPRVVSH